MDKNKGVKKVSSIVIAVLILFSVFAVVSFTPAMAEDPRANEFYGTVKIYGEDASVGTVVKGYIDYVERGNITVLTEGEYGSLAGYLSIRGTEADDEKTIVFTVNGSQTSGNEVRVIEIATYEYPEEQEPAPLTQLNLTQPFRSMPNEFYGTVKIYGEGASVGTVVKGYIESEERGSLSVIAEGEYGSLPEPEYLVIMGTGEDDGKTIVFTVTGSQTSGNEIQATETATFEYPEWWESPPLTQLNLTVIPLTTGDININEIMYKPEGYDEWYEWVELYNNDTEAIDVSGWVLNATLGCDDTTLSGTMGIGSYMVIAKNVSAFHARYPGATCPKIGGNWCALADTGDTISLWDGTSTLADSVTYDDIAAENYTLERNETGGWEESRVEGGTPCEENTEGKPPVVTEPTAEPQIIPDDTDNEPLWGELSNLSVVVTDASEITSVTINLSAIGGSAVQAMTRIGSSDVWNVSMNATNGTAGWTGAAYVPYLLLVNATDEYGNSNTAISIELTVMKNGDVNEDGSVNFADVTYLANHVVGTPGYESMKDTVADVNGDSSVNFGDVTYLANHVVHVPGYEKLK